MRNFVLLDFDGVMIPQGYSKVMEYQAKASRGEISLVDVFGEYFSPDAVENLRILVSKTGALLVITSRWKRDLDTDGLHTMWSYRYNFGGIVGSTPDLADDAIRGEEIEAWLKENHRASIRYVILDDMGPSQFLPEQLPYLVQCDSNLGFTASALEKALKLFS